MLVDKVPEENETVISTGGKMTTPAWGPFDTVQCSGMTLQLKQSLAGLPHIENADNAGILGEGG